MTLDQRVALVTGASRGIGAAICRRLAGEGARVVASSRASDALEQVASEVGGVAIAADLGDRNSIRTLVAQIGERVGRIDILVNNAGVASSAPLARISDDSWDLTMAINVTAPFLLCRALVPAMVEAGWGRVINVASNAGLTGYGYTAAYCASKHALVGLTRALAVDLGRTGVTVNAICPGWVDTDMAGDAVSRISGKTGRAAADVRAELAAMSPQNRLVSADEVAHWAVGLCADEARGMNGQTVVIDGGQVLK